MNPSLIVTHCLALWNEHNGQLTQADKDFFDERIPRVEEKTNDVFMAVLLLLTMRLSMDLPEEEAEIAAVALTEPHAARYGNGLRA